MVLPPHSLFDQSSLLALSQVHVPSNVLIDGVYAQHFFGTALVLHHSPSLGLLVVDRNTVAVSISDILLSFCAYPVEVPGEVRMKSRALSPND